MHLIELDQAHTALVLGDPLKPHQFPICGTPHLDLLVSKLQYRERSVSANETGDPLRWLSERASQRN